MYAVVTAPDLLQRPQCSAPNKNLMPVFVHKTVTMIIIIIILIFIYS